MGDGSDGGTRSDAREYVANIYIMTAGLNLSLIVPYSLAVKTQAPSFGNWTQTTVEKYFLNGGNTVICARYASYI